MSAESNKIIRAGILFCFHLSSNSFLLYFTQVLVCDRWEIIRNRSFATLFTTGINNMDFDKQKKISHNKNRFEKSSPIYNLPEFKQKKFRAQFSSPFFPFSDFPYSRKRHYSDLSSLDIT